MRDAKEHPVYITPHVVRYERLRDGRWEQEGNMARIAGVDLPNEKRIEAGLTYIYGIGWTTSRKILEKTGINPDTRVKDLTEEEAGKIRKVIEDENNM